MFVTKEELTIEVAKVDGVQIDNVDLAEAGENKVLQELATNSSGTDHQNAGLDNVTICRGRKWIERGQTCLILGYREPRDCFANRSRPMAAKQD